jgi:hypothetical protein
MGGLSAGLLYRVYRPVSMMLQKRSGPGQRK